MSPNNKSSDIRTGAYMTKELGEMLTAQMRKKRRIRGEGGEKKGEM